MQWYKPGVCQGLRQKAKVGRGVLDSCRSRGEQACSFESDKGHGHWESRTATKRWYVGRNQVSPKSSSFWLRGFRWGSLSGWLPKSSAVHQALTFPTIRVGAWRKEAATRGAALGGDRLITHFGGWGKVVTPKGFLTLGEEQIFGIGGL